MTRLPVLLLLLVTIFRVGGQVAPINEVVADTLRQTVDIFLTNRPFAGSDPREGIIKLVCVPCKLLLMVIRLSTQNIPGIAPLLTGVCTFVLGDQQTCTDQIGFIALALEFADNTQGCERFWACAKPPEPDDAKKKKIKDDKKGTRRLSSHRVDSEMPEDSIILAMPDHLNSTDEVSYEILRQIPRSSMQGSTPRPNIIRGTMESVSGLAGGMYNSFTKLVGLGGGPKKTFSDPQYAKHNPYNARDVPEQSDRPGFGANVGFGVFTSPFLEFLGKKKR